MKQILVEIDEPTLARLERVAPGRRRKRSAFLRAAIRAALDALAEESMAQAYRRQPQAAGEAAFEAGGWEPWSPPPRRGGSRR